MNRTLAVAVAATTLGVAIPVIGIAAPAYASCTSPTARLTSPNYLGSELFNASIGCDGVWANGTQTHSDYVRGWYYKNDVWELSTYGWQWVMNGDPASKLIGNTIDGRRCKGQSYTYLQDVYYNY